MYPRRLLSILLASSGFHGAVSCSPPFDSSCCRAGTCPCEGEDGGAAGDGAGTGGEGGAAAEGQGGSTSGGTGASGAAGAGGEAGGSSPEPCGGACGGATPVCQESTGECVGCSKDEHCGAAAPYCDEAENACVQCLDNEDCAEPLASRCSAGQCAGCAANADCAHLNGKTTCDTAASECVECTGTDYAACGESEGTPLVCDSLTRACTEELEHDAGLCIPCVSDAHCRLGQACVLQRYGEPAEDVGSFCHWKQGGGEGAPTDCPTQGRPYVELVEGATSIDGQVADVCALALSTCAARNEFRTKVCGTAAPDDALCAFAPPDDSKCVPFGAEHRCTMTCGSDDDCPVGFDCDTGASPPVCEL